MKTKCLGCGAVASLDVLLAGNDVGQAFIAALNVPPSLKKQMVLYLALFRPAQRELTFSRATKLLNDMTPYINSGTLQYDRQRKNIPLAGWAWALAQVLERASTGKLSTPLANHHYLYSVAMHYDPRQHHTADDTNASTAERSKDTLFLNGVHLPPLAGMSKLATYQHVTDNRKAGETLDETYHRLALNHNTQA